MKNIFVLILICLTSNILYAQIPISTPTDPGRGMYVDNFFKWVSDAGSVDRNLTILGNDTKEDALLEFCDQNHITYIILYNVNTILDHLNDTYDGKTVKQHYCEFLDKAKNLHCISKIGVAGGGTFFSNPQLRTATPPITLNASERSRIGFDPAIIEQVKETDDPEFERSEQLKFFIRATNLFGSATCGVGLDYIDVYVTEYEFWWPIPTDDLCIRSYPQERYPEFQTLLTSIADLRTIYNDPALSTHTNRIYTEVYISNLDRFVTPYTPPHCTTTTDPGVNDDHLGIATFIDEYYPPLSNPPPVPLPIREPRANRVLAASYAKDPTVLYNAHRPEDYYLERIVDFGNVNPAHHTDYHPLFSAEAWHLGSDINTLGQWFVEPGVNMSEDVPVENRNIFTAEKIYYDDFFWDTNTAAKDNIIEPGGFQWFTSSVMVGVLDDPRTFSSNSPVCEMGSLDFYYQGPIDPAINYTFSVGGQCSKTGTTTTYTPVTNSIFDNPAISDPYIDLGVGTCILSTGTYPAILTLTYPNGCTNTYTQDVQVVAGPTIEAIGSTHLCRQPGIGQTVVLKASSGGTSYQWRRDGTNIANANTSSYVAEDAGVYDCDILGPCSGRSDGITVTVTDIPAATISLSFQGTSCTAILEAPIHPDPLLSYSYFWSNGSTNSSIQTGNSGEFSVQISDNGCSANGTMVYEKFHVTSDVLEPCTGLYNGSIELEITDGKPASPSTAPYTYNWSSPVVSTSNVASNLRLGTYNCEVTDIHGCKRNVVIPLTDEALLTTTFVATSSTCPNSNDGSVTTTVTGGNGQYIYFWTPTSQTTKNLVAVPSGIYDLLVTTMNGCSFTSQVTVPSTNPITITDPILTPVCVNSTHDLQALAGGVPINGVYSGQYVSLNGSAYEFTPTAPGVYTITYSVIASGCSTSTDVTVTGLTIPSVTVESDESDPTRATCQFNADVELTVTNCTNCGSSPQFIWYHHDVPTTSPATPFNQTPTTDDFYIVNVVPCSTVFYFAEVIPSSDACPDISSGNFKSNNITVDFNTQTTGTSSNATTTNTVCFNSSDGEITLYSKNGCSFVGINYTGPVNGNIAQPIGSSLPDPLTIPSLLAGDYQLIIQYATCSPETLLVTVHSNSNPAPPIIDNGLFGFTCSASLTASGSFNAYQWYLNGSIISGANTNTLTAQQNGNYTVVATDQHGCTVTSSSQGVDLTIDVTITGLTTTCGTSYSVPLSGNNAIYVWSVPQGIPQPPNINAVTINWGNAHSGGTISCTVSNACGISATGSIIVTPLLTSTSASYACPGLNNGSAGVIASGGKLPYTYLWTGGSNPTSSLVSNLSSGSYTVTVTDANGCTSTASATVSNFPSGLPSPIIAGTSSASPGSHVYTLSNYNSTYDNYYSWNAIANSGSATISYPNNNKQSATIQWPSSGGRIVVSFGVQGCLQTTTYYVQPYCQSTFTYLDGSNQSAITSANVITRSNMTFNGVLNITSDFTFLNCGVVSFAPGAKILVQAGYSLTIDNCDFTASNSCCKMWKGIELQPGARIVVRNNTYISQAEYAIIANNGSVYKIKDSHFRNNYISLQVGTGASTTNTNSNLFNTDFYSDPHSCGGTTYNNFLPKYDGQTLNPGSLPLAGIKADNVTFMKFGASTPVAGGDVRFNNLSNGVISNNSNVYIQNSTFKNIPGGAGVLANGGLLSLHGMGGDYVNSENTFENCHWGVNARSCELAVHSSKSSDDLSTAVYYSDCGTVNITDNAFSASYYGIHGYHNPNSTVAIEKNKIHMSGTPIGSACIRLDEFGLDPVVRVADNDLYLNSSRYGILIYSVHNAMISENYIQMNNAYNISGIRSYYSSGNTIQCNTVNAMQRYPSGQSGISMSLSPENKVACNWMNNQHEGIRISGACSPMDLQGNVFNDHNFGLSLTYNGLMGVQENKGNLWNGTYTSYGAYLSGLNSNSAMANQVLFYDPSSTGTPPTTNNDILNYGWFQDNGNSEEFSCVAYDCQPFVPVGDDPRVEDEIIAEEDDIGTEYVEPSNYFADRFLFERLMADPSLMQNNPILQAFYDQKIYGTIGRFTEMGLAIEDAVKWETVYETVYSLNESMIKAAADSLSIIDSLLERGYTGQTNAESLNQTIKDLMASNDVIRETIAQMKEFRIANSLDDNSEIPVSDLYDENESTVNQIYLETVASGHYELSGSQILQLFAVAEQCPFSGGPSVYKARSLYNLTDPTADWDDDAICILNGIQPRKRKLEIQYTIFPNPTTGIVSMKYSLSDGEKGLLNIYNVLGVLLSSSVLNSEGKQIDVDLSEYAPALYNYKIMVDDEQLREGMISIIR